MSAPPKESAAHHSYLRAIAPLAAPPSTRLIGILPGEGIGPDVVNASLRLLDALDAISPLHIERITGGPIGLAAPGNLNGSVTPDTHSFCEEIFNKGGVLFCGPGGGRFVYDLRDRFDLFCKIAPIQPSPALAHATRFKPETLRNIDLLVVRDNSAGIYQGTARTITTDPENPIAEHTFSYSAQQIRQIVEAGASLARNRRGILHVIIKDGGIPAISNLWRKIANEVAAAHDLTPIFLNADFAAYAIVQNPQHFDILVTPNMIGDILADLAAVFLGSRGLSYSGNFSASGRAAYQTGHGAAYDLAPTGRANPAAQFLALAMLLRESFDLPQQAAMIEQALTTTWSQHHTTDDLPSPNAHKHSLAEFTTQVIKNLPRS